MYLIMLSEQVSSTLFWVFGMTRPGIEPLSPWPLPKTLPTRTMGDTNEKKLFFQLLVLRIPHFSLRFVLLGWVFLHINRCRFFNAKSSLCGYIKYIWFGLGWFYGILTIVGHLMPNRLYTYISNVYDLVWVGFWRYICNILILDRAVNQEMHLCK